MRIDKFIDRFDIQVKLFFKSLAYLLFKVVVFVPHGFEVQVQIFLLEFHQTSYHPVVNDEFDLFVYPISCNTLENITFLKC